MSFNSFSLSSLVDHRPRFTDSGLAGVSNVMLAIILTALFCSFWSLFMSVVLQIPHTEEQYLNCGSTMLICKFFKMFCGRNCFVCFSAPRDGRPSSRLYPCDFSKLDAYQSEHQDILFLLHFVYLCHVL